MQLLQATKISDLYASPNTLHQTQRFLPCHSTCRLATISPKEYLALITIFVEHYKIDPLDSPTSILLVSLECTGGGLLMSGIGGCLIA